jgi:hypothetical protein
MDRIFLAVVTSALLVLGTAAAILVTNRNDKAVSMIRAPPVPSVPPADGRRQAPGER